MEPVVDTHDDATAARLHPAGAPVDHLVVALECDRPLAGGARYSLEGIEQVTIGRGDRREGHRRKDRVLTLDLRIPGRSMSSAQARLVRVGYEWAVEDLGSTNGTFVDGVRVTQAVLRSGALLEVGHTFLRVHTLPARDGAPEDADADGTVDTYATVDSAFGADLERLTALFAGGVPVLLLGDSGTGKEVIARRLHARGRRPGPFVAVNCGAIPQGLVESQLFGHVKGAFSGASRDETGHVRAAHGGTLFLDEIADLPKASQAALLRVLQEKEVVPVGATSPVAVDMRLLAATHQPIERLVERGRFREDLYARIAGCTLHIPPLRERLHDIGILVAALLVKLAPTSSRAAYFEPDAGRAILSYHWPLNVRELEQCLATCCVLAKEGPIRSSHLPPTVAAALRMACPADDVPASVLRSESYAQLRLTLLEHLSRHQGNVSDVARAMGKPRTQIHRWCKRFNVNPEAFRN